MASNSLLMVNLPRNHMVNASEFSTLAIDLESTNIKVHMVSPGFTATALNNFQGTDTGEEGSVEPIRVALAEDIPTGSFTGPARYAGADNIVPW